MASQAPIAPPPMPPRQGRSLAGPAVLIVMGIAFLLSNLGILHWNDLGRTFARFWPLLIILWGVIKLIEYQQAQKQGLRPRGIGAGGVFMIILLIVTGLSVSQAYRFPFWGAIRDNIEIDDAPMFGETFNYEDKLDHEFPAGGSVKITNDRGAVNLTVSDDNQVHVAVHKRVNAETQEDADKYNGGTKPDLSVNGSTVSINGNTQGSGNHWVAADMDISLPRKAAAYITSRRGSVTVMGRDGDVQISSQHGDTSVVDVNGRVTLNLESSSAKVSQVNGDVVLDGRTRDISVEDVKGAVRMTGEFFDGVKLAKISSTVAFRSSRTDMEFSRLDGDLDLGSDDLRASDMTGPVRLITRSKDIRLTGVSGDVRVENSNGPVELHLKQLGSVQVQNRKDDIQVFLPAKAAFRVDARARDGSIESDFAGVTVNTAHEDANASGEIGSGGPNLLLTNEHANIEIRKGGVMTETPVPPAPPNSKAPHLPAPKEPVEPTDN